MENAGFLPSRIIAGETIDVSAANTLQDWAGLDITFDNFKPTSATLAYQFAAPTPITVNAVANGGNTGWTLTVTGAQTLVWSPGRLTFVGLATVGTKTYAVDQGYIDVDASPLRVSSWVAVLASVDAAIASYATTPHGSFNVDGLNVTYRSLSQLTDLRDYVKARLAEDTAKRPRRIIRARLTCSH